MNRADLPRSGTLVAYPIRQFANSPNREDRGLGLQEHARKSVGGYLAGRLPGSQPTRQTVTERCSMTETSAEPEPLPPLSPPPVPRRNSPAMWLGTGLGVGLLGPAPGTLGALLGLPIAWGVSHLDPWWQVACVVVLGLIGIPICTQAARDLGGMKDPGPVVLDEIFSIPITFLWVPLNHWGTLAAGFALHRLFDITKPPPARQLERLPQGLGIMADDWAAGIYSCLSLHLLLFLVS